MGDDSPLQAAVSASESAAADPESQQGGLIDIADEDSKEEAIVVPDSDDDEDWAPPARGVPAPPLAGAGGPTGGSFLESDQVAAPSNSEEPDAAESAPAPDGADFGKALDDDRPKVCHAPHSSDAGPKCMHGNICAVPNSCGWMVSGNS